VQTTKPEQNSIQLSQFHRGNHTGNDTIICRVPVQTVYRERYNKGRTIRKEMGGMGDFLPARIFFLAHFQCKNFFFGYSAMHDFFFFLRKYFPYAQFAIELIKNNATLFY